MESQNKIELLIVEYMKRLYKKNYITILGGNISIKHNNLIYITPSKKDKANLCADDIAIVDLYGNIIRSNISISIEKEAHTSVYFQRHDVGAIIHSHPLWASLFCFSDITPQLNLLEEAMYYINNIEYVDFKPMGSTNLAEEISKKCNNTNVIIVKNHGIFTFGKNITEAFERLELIERIAFYSYLLNKKDIKVFTLNNLFL
ncbi:MAG: class II aldolase/adducin family protein [Bacteroidales bacterium]|nr:class II aldolase/adducin family protein [Bacteroidales bacterium]